MSISNFKSIRLNQMAQGNCKAALPPTSKEISDKISNCKNLTPESREIFCLLLSFFSTIKAQNNQAVAELEVKVNSIETSLKKEIEELRESVRRLQSSVVASDDRNEKKIECFSK